MTHRQFKSPPGREPRWLLVCITLSVHCSCELVERIPAGKSLVHIRCPDACFRTAFLHQKPQRETIRTQYDWGSAWLWGWSPPKTEHHHISSGAKLMGRQLLQLWKDIYVKETEVLWGGVSFFERLNVELLKSLWEDGDRSRGKSTSAPEEESFAARIGGPEKGELGAECPMSLFARFWSMNALRFNRENNRIPLCTTVSVH